jgi:hypothetical protein
MGAVTPDSASYAGLSGAILMSSPRTLKKGNHSCSLTGAVDCVSLAEYANNVHKGNAPERVGTRAGEWACRRWGAGDFSYFGLRSAGRGCRNGSRVRSPHQYNVRSAFWPENRGVFRFIRFFSPGKMAKFRFFPLFLGFSRFSGKGTFGVGRKGEGDFKLEISVWRTRALWPARAGRRPLWLAFARICSLTVGVAREGGASVFWGGLRKVSLGRDASGTEFTGLFRIMREEEFGQDLQDWRRERNGSRVRSPRRSKRAVRSRLSAFCGGGCCCGSQIRARRERGDMSPRRKAASCRRSPKRGRFVRLRSLPLAWRWGVFFGWTKGKGGSARGRTELHARARALPRPYLEGKERVALGRRPIV